MNPAERVLARLRTRRDELERMLQTVVRPVLEKPAPDSAEVQAAMHRLHLESAKLLSTVAETTEFLLQCMVQKHAADEADGEGWKRG